MQIMNTTIKHEIWLLHYKYLVNQINKLQHEYLIIIFSVQMRKSGWRIMGLIWNKIPQCILCYDLQLQIGKKY